jgi:hypothetical protein
LELGGNHVSRQIGGGLSQNLDTAFRPGGYTLLTVAAAYYGPAAVGAVIIRRYIPVPRISPAFN